MEDYGQLDGSIFYNINKNIKIGIQATNILGTKTYLSGSVLDNGNVLPFRAAADHRQGSRVRCCASSEVLTLDAGKIIRAPDAARRHPGLFSASSGSRRSNQR